MVRCFLFLLLVPLHPFIKGCCIFKCKKVVDEVVHRFFCYNGVNLWQKT